MRTSWKFRTRVTVAEATGRRHLSGSQCYFVLNTIDTPGAFDVKIMKKWNRWVYIAFSFLPSDFQSTIFGEPSWERWGFSQETSAFGNKSFSPLPITNAKKCRNQSEK